MFRRLLVVLALTTAVLVPAGAAHADSCGDTSAQWVSTLGSTWSGTLGPDSLTVVLLPAANLAVSVVDVVPVAGEWNFTAPFEWNGATEGFTYYFQVNASTCAGGKVTHAEGTGYDGLLNAYHVSIDRGF